MTRQKIMTIGGIAAIAGLIADQASKWALLDLVGLREDPRRIEILPVFDLVMRWNQDTSFNLFHIGTSWGPYAFALAALVIVALLVVWLSRIANPIVAIAIGAVIGGEVAARRRQAEELSANDLVGEGRSQVGELCADAPHLFDISFVSCELADLVEGKCCRGGVSKGVIVGGLCERIVDRSRRVVVEGVEPSLGCLSEELASGKFRVVWRHHRRDERSRPRTEIVAFPGSAATGRDAPFQQGPRLFRRTCGRSPGR